MDTVAHRVMHVDEQIKRIISGPFDFHHVTHTSAAQFQALDNASNNELVTEFSAIRASQRPDTELKGIRAEEIHFRDFSSENLWNSGAASKAGESRSSSPPLSPRASPSRRSSESPRGSRGIENFSPPGSRHQTAPGSPSIIPPPRVSSKQACSDISEPAPPALDELLGLHTQQTYPDFVYPNSDDEADEVSSLARINLAEIFQPDVGHAVTTADDSTRFTRRPSTIPNPSDLEDVPEEEEEEEEATFWRESPEHSSRPSTSHSSRLDHPPSAVPSSSNTGAPDSNLSLRVPEHLSSRFSDTLASPTLPHLVPESPIPQAQDLRRKFPACGKSVINDVSESWDADIDYCYEHAAESNCNFDWHRSSLDEADDTVPGVSLTVADSPDKPGDGDRNRTQHPLGTSPHGFATPELEPGSTQSLFTSHEAVTPLTAGDEVDFITESKQTVQGDYFKPIHTHILSSTSLGKEITPDTLYEEYLAGDGESDRHFPFYSQRDSQSLDHPVSPRSSIYSPLSKCNSQESIILSRAASIARKHRSSVSTLSVPELVHSASSSREYTFQENPAPVEQSTSATLGQTPSYPNSSSAAATKADGPPSAARKQSIASDKGFNGKKTRTSYSLFPSRTGSQRPL